MKDNGNTAKGSSNQEEPKEQQKAEKTQDNYKKGLQFKRMRDQG